MISTMAVAAIAVTQANAGFFDKLKPSDVDLKKIEEKVVDKLADKLIGELEKKKHHPSVAQGDSFTEAAADPRVFATIDFSAGFMIGLYAPIQTSFRNADCQSRAFNFALNILNYAKYFDKPYEVNVSSVLQSTLQIVFTSLSASSALGTCTDQLAALRADSTPWTDSF